MTCITNYKGKNLLNEAQAHSIQPQHIPDTNPCNQHISVYYSSFFKLLETLQISAQHHFPLRPYVAELCTKAPRAAQHRVVRSIATRQRWAETSRGPHLGCAQLSGWIFRISREFLLGLSPLPSCMPVCGTTSTAQPHWFLRVPSRPPLLAMPAKAEAFPQPDKIGTPAALL